MGWALGTGDISTNSPLGAGGASTGMGAGSGKAAAAGVGAMTGAAAAAGVSDEDYHRMMAVIEEADRLEKERMRREMGLS